MQQVSTTSENCPCVEIVCMANYFAMYESTNMSEPIPSVLEAQQRAVKSWNSDGLNSIIGGLGFFALGLAFLLEHHNYRPGVALLLNSAAVLILLDQSFFHKSVRFLKARITYPRTGYVEPPSPWRLFRPNPVLLSPSEQEELQRNKWLYGGLAVMLVLFVYSLYAGPRWLAFAGGAWMVLVLAWYYRGKFPWYASLPLLAYSAIIAFSPADKQDNIAVALSGLGVFVFVKGVANLSRYLLQHPAHHS